MTIGERFVMVLKKKGVTQKSFAQQTKYSEQAITKLIKGQTKSPKADLIAQIGVLFPDLNLRWLLLEEDEMFADKAQILHRENNILKSDLLNAQNKIIKLLERVED